MHQSDIKTMIFEMLKKADGWVSFRKLFLEYDLGYSCFCFIKAIFEVAHSKLLTFFTAQILLEENEELFKNLRLEYSDYTGRTRGGRKHKQDQ